MIQNIVLIPMILTFFLIRNTILSISNILSILFIKCIENGVYPDVRKISKVIILYKKENKNDCLTIINITIITILL